MVLLLCILALFRSFPTVCANYVACWFEIRHKHIACFFFSSNLWQKEPCNSAKVSLLLIKTIKRIRERSDVLCYI